MIYFLLNSGGIFISYCILTFIASNGLPTRPPQNPAGRRGGGGNKRIKKAKKWEDRVSREVEQNRRGRRAFTAIYTSSCCYKYLVVKW